MRQHTLFEPVSGSAMRDQRPSRGRGSWGPVSAKRRCFSSKRKFNQFGSRFFRQIFDFLVEEKPAMKRFEFPIATVDLARFTLPQREDCCSKGTFVTVNTYHVTVFSLLSVCAIRRVWRLGDDSSATGSGVCVPPTAKD